METTDCLSAVDFPVLCPTLHYTAISLVDSNIEREDEGCLLLARLGKEF